MAGQQAAINITLLLIHPVPNNEIVKKYIIKEKPTSGNFDGLLSSENKASVLVYPVPNNEVVEKYKCNKKTASGNVNGPTSSENEEIVEKGNKDHVMSHATKLPLHQTQKSKR